MVRVYRVEHLKTGAGLYQDGVYRQWLGGDDENYSKHPMPVEDPALRGCWDAFQRRHSSSLRFGFASPAQMRRWLYKARYRQKLDELGFRLVCYEVPDDLALIGESQAAFVRDKAKRLRARRIA